MLGPLSYVTVENDEPLAAEDASSAHRRTFANTSSNVTRWLLAAHASEDRSWFTYAH
jgi:hypothetical protein